MKNVSNFEFKRAHRVCGGIVFATLGLALFGLQAGGCSKSDSGFGCSQSIAGQEFCFSYSNLTSDQDSEVRMACSAGGGSVVTTCPTDGLIGCCSETVAGISAQQCYYFGTSSTDQMACSAASGKWTDGDGAISSGSSGSGGASGSSSSSSGGNPPSLACSVTVAGESFCYSYSNLPPNEESAARSACTTQGGSTVSACPTAGLVGCCAVTAGGIAAEECFYFGTSSDDATACSAAGGTWTDGTAGLSSSSSTGSSTGSSSGGPCVAGTAGCPCYPNDTCNADLTCTSGICATSTTPTCTAKAGGPVCCPEGYCTIGTAHGYAFAYSDAADGGLSSATLRDDGSLCVSGSAAGVVCADQTCFATHWGAGIGVNVNQASGTTSVVGNYAAAGSAGVTYALDSLPPNARLVVGDSTTDYCVSLNGTSGTIPWTSFNSTCWDPANGIPLSGPPASFTSVRFQVATDDVYGLFTDFDFCLTQLHF